MSDAALSASCCYAGIDIACQQFDLCLLECTGEVLVRRSFANNKTGVKQALKLLERQSCPVRVCLEPTSRYHELLAAALHASPRCIPHLPNPRSVHDFASALSRRGKTDRSDAELLAVMAQCLPLAPWAPPARQLSLLNDIATRLMQLTRNRTQEQNRLNLYRKCTAAPAVLRDLQSHIALLKRRGVALEQQALLLIHDDPLLNRRYQQLLSVTGIAQTSGILLLAFLSMLPAGLSKGQWTACAGLDPAVHESGQTAKPRRISRRGNRKIRAAIFMPALVITRCNPQLAAYNQRQLAKGKKPLMVLNAVMVKLLHIIWAMWRYDQFFDPAKLIPREA